jgi:hypothetical protein
LLTITVLDVSVIEIVTPEVEALDVDCVTDPVITGFTIIGELFAVGVELIFCDVTAFEVF